jgi:hypothetical protein
MARAFQKPHFQKRYFGTKRRKISKVERSVARWPHIVPRNEEQQCRTGSNRKCPRFSGMSILPSAPDIPHRSLHVRFVPNGDIDLPSRHRRHQLAALSGIPDFEGQQDVARQTAPLGIARSYVEHTIHGTAVCQNAVHRRVIARRVDFPKQLGIGSGIGT